MVRRWVVYELPKRSRAEAAAEEVKKKNKKKKKDGKTKDEKSGNGKDKKDTKKTWPLVYTCTCGSYTSSGRIRIRSEVH